MDGNEVDPHSIEICKRPDGTKWCLGAGSYGTVRTLLLSASFQGCACAAPHAQYRVRCVQVYKAMRHGVAEVAVKMVKCVVRLSQPERMSMAAVSCLCISNQNLRALPSKPTGTLIVSRHNAALAVRCRQTMPGRCS